MTTTMDKIKARLPLILNSRVQQPKINRGGGVNGDSSSPSLDNSLDPSLSEENLPCHHAHDKKTQKEGDAAAMMALNCFSISRKNVRLKAPLPR